MRTVEWDYERDQLRMIDQRVLPDEFRIETYSDYREVAGAIQQMVVRGAPAIGASAGFGLALAAYGSSAITDGDLTKDLKQAAEVLLAARPTAVNLKWAIDRILRYVSDAGPDVDGLKKAVLAEAQMIADEDVAINHRMASYGAALLEDGDTVIHHCNTGALATVDWGTALGVIREAHVQGKSIHVLVDETRPRLQGARLTAWELSTYGISYDIITDNAAGYFLKSGVVNKVLFGADRVAANGDVANKIGTYMLALSASDNSVPVYCVVPTSTIDLSTQRGSFIPIEERPEQEVLDITFEGQTVVPKDASARNPAFDITPHHLVSAFITETGVVYPPYKNNLECAYREAQER